MDNLAVIYKDGYGSDIDVTNTDWNTRRLSNHARDALVFTFHEPINFMSIECYAEIGRDRQPVCAEIEVYDAAHHKIKYFTGHLWNTPGFHTLTFTIGRNSKDITRIECKAGGGESASLSYCKLQYNWEHTAHSNILSKG